MKFEGRLADYILYTDYFTEASSTNPMCFVGSLADYFSIPFQDNRVIRFKGQKLIRPMPHKIKSLRLLRGGGGEFGLESPISNE